MMQYTNKITWMTLCFVGLLTYGQLSFAMGGKSSADDFTPSNKIEASLERSLSKFLRDDVVIQSIQKSSMEGVYIVLLEEQELFVYSDGNYLMIGDVFDVRTQKNLKEKRRDERLSSAIDQISESDMIVMGESKDRYVTVFTDTDCHYCQKFHKTVPELQEKGLQVRYLMFPRTGIGSGSYREAVSVWCADDQVKAMTLAKAGKRISEKNCDNPVEQQYLLGQSIGIRGTPTIILDNGKIIPGFVPPDVLLQEAGI